MNTQWTCKILFKIIRRWGNIATNLGRSFLPHPLHYTDVHIGRQDIKTDEMYRDTRLRIQCVNKRVSK